MIIIGIDGADYSIAKDYFDVKHLEVDLEPKHTATIWTSYFTGLTPEEHGIRSWEPVIGRLPKFDYIWDYGDWTVFAAPVCMPPFSRGYAPSDYHMKDEENAWNTELNEFMECYEKHDSNHFLGVIRCIDTASHARPKEVALEWYGKVFDLIKQIKIDLMMSDHGFWGFGRRKGDADHSPDGIVKGVNVKKASELLQYMKNLKASIE